LRTLLFLPVALIATASATGAPAKKAAGPRPVEIAMATVSPSQYKARFGTKAALRAAVVASAKALIGKPYVLGDAGQVGYDCSSLVQRAFAENGIELPRVSVGQWSSGRAADPFHPTEGDLVFFATGESGVSHVGVYAGDGTFVHAPGTGGKVKVTAMSSPYYKARYAGAVDVIGDE